MFLAGATCVYTYMCTLLSAVHASTSVCEYMCVYAYTYMCVDLCLVM